MKNKKALNLYKKLKMILELINDQYNRGHFNLKLTPNYLLNFLLSPQYSIIFSNRERIKRPRMSECYFIRKNHKDKYSASTVFLKITYFDTNPDVLRLSQFNYINRFVNSFEYDIPYHRGKLEFSNEEYHVLINLQDNNYIEVTNEQNLHHLLRLHVILDRLNKNYLEILNEFILERL